MRTIEFTNVPNCFHQVVVNSIGYLRRSIHYCSVNSKNICQPLNKYIITVAYIDFFNVFSNVSHGFYFYHFYSTMWNLMT